MGFLRTIKEGRTMGIFKTNKEGGTE